jgi:hypothetical protein
VLSHRRKDEHLFEEGAVVAPAARIADLYLADARRIDGEQERRKRRPPLDRGEGEQLELRPPTIG